MNDGQGLENRMGKQCKFGHSEDAVRSNSLRLRGDSDHEPRKGACARYQET